MSNKSESQTVPNDKIEILIKSSMASVNQVTYMQDNNPINIFVNKFIADDNKVKFVSDVVNGCFNNDNYQPYFKDFFFKIAILEYFTNISVDIPIENLHALISDTNIVERVLKVIEDGLITEMYQIINDLISYRKQEILSAQKQELEKAVASLEQYVDTLTSIGKAFENVDTNEMMGMFKKISEMNENKLALAVLDGRAKSDVDNAVQLNFENQNL